MWKDFKKFAVKGNVLDLAVGVVVGGAFGKIVTSLVSDIIMPMVGLLTGSLQFTALKYIIRHSPDGKTDLTLNYGTFIQNIVDFIIISFSIFLFITLINKLKTKQEEEEAKPAVTPEDVVLLKEIRDLLKNQKDKK